MEAVSSAVTRSADSAQSRLAHRLGGYEQVSYSIPFLLLHVMIPCILTPFNFLRSCFVHGLKLQMEVRVEMTIAFSGSDCNFSIGIDDRLGCQRPVFWHWW